MYLLRGEGRAAEAGGGEIDGKVNILREQILFFANTYFKLAIKIKRKPKKRDYFKVRNSRPGLRPLWLLDHSAKQASFATVHCAVSSWEYTSSGRDVSDCWMAANMNTGGLDTVCHSLTPQKTCGVEGIPHSRFVPVISQTPKCCLHSTATCSMIWRMQTGRITGSTKRT
jgi:hypothetical protein